MKNTSTNSSKEIFGFSLGDVKYKSESRPFLGSPRGIALDEDLGIMYVCEMFDKSVHVFTMDGSHITTFGIHIFDKPWGILLYDGLLFVTDVGKHSLMMFRGCRMEEVNQITAKFKFARGISIADKTEELFIADEDNHRVVICTINPLRFSRVFVSGVTNPYDVKIASKADTVYVLKSSSPPILKYNLSGVLLASILPKGVGINGAWFFCLSPDNHNFIISDYKANKVQIYGRNQTLVREINFKSSVFGVAITSDLKIIVGSYCINKIMVFTMM